MPQIFPKSANPVFRIALLGLVAGAGLSGWLVDALARSAYVTRQGQARTQPIQFSHAHHVGGVGLDCRYCHGAVEVSSTAGIPAMQTCMNCHSQLWAQAPMLEPVRRSLRTGRAVEWIRVHDLPDYVYFNHSIHVAKGVGCETCHGRVDRMALVSQEATLQMDWCLGCHRDPGPNLRPRDAVFTMGWQPPTDRVALAKRLVREYRIRPTNLLTSCSTCHR